MVCTPLGGTFKKSRGSRPDSDLRSGFSFALLAPSKHLVSGPCGVIILWRLAPPGLNAPFFASYDLPKKKGALYGEREARWLE